MKAAFYYGIGDIRVEEVPIPEIGENEVLVKVKACAVCGTDNRIYKFGHFKIPAGVKRVLGHETCGEVAKVGIESPAFCGGRPGRGRTQYRLRRLPHVHPGFQPALPDV